MLKLLLSDGLSIHHICLYLLACILGILLSKLWVNIFLIRVEKHLFFPCLSVYIKIILDSVKAYILVEQVLVLPNFNVLLLVLFILVTLTHAIQHLFQIRIHLLVKS